MDSLIIELQKEKGKVLPKLIIMKKMTTKSILILFFFTGLLTSCGDDKSLEWLKK